MQVDLEEEDNTLMVEEEEDIWIVEEEDKHQDMKEVD